MSAPSRGPAVHGTFRRWVLQDWRVNPGRRESQLILAWYRTAQWALARWGAPGRRFAHAYRLLTSLLLSVEIPAEAAIGPGLRLHHPHGIVLHPSSALGRDCTLRQNVTIGSIQRRDGTDRGSPRLGDGVDLGAGCMLLGPVAIGDRARIGALALVLRDVPADATAVGNPARVLQRDEAASR